MSTAVQGLLRLAGPLWPGILRQHATRLHWSGLLASTELIKCDNTTERLHVASKRGPQWNHEGAYFSGCASSGLYAGHCLRRSERERTWKALKKGAETWSMGFLVSAGDVQKYFCVRLCKACWKLQHGGSALEKVWRFSKRILRRVGLRSRKHWAKEHTAHGKQESGNVKKTAFVGHQIDSGGVNKICRREALRWENHLTWGGVELQCRAKRQRPVQEASAKAAPMLQRPPPGWGERGEGQRGALLG